MAGSSPSPAGAPHAPRCPGYLPAAADSLPGFCIGHEWACVCRHGHGLPDACVGTDYRFPPYWRVPVAAQNSDEKDSSQYRWRATPRHLAAARQLARCQRHPPEAPAEETPCQFPEARQRLSHDEQGGQTARALQNGSRSGLPVAVPASGRVAMEVSDADFRKTGRTGFLDPIPNLFFYLPWYGLRCRPAPVFKR